MTDLSPTLTAIDALAYEGITILSRLKVLLDQELEALKSREVDLIHSINLEKQTILSHFDQNNHSRAEHLIKIGLSVSKDGLDTLIAQSQNKALVTQFHSHWNDLESILKATMDANQRNEQVLMRNSQNIDKLLSVLRGQKTSNSLYTAKGAKGNYTGQSHIGKA